MIGSQERGVRSQQPTRFLTPDSRLLPAGWEHFAHEVSRRGGIDLHGYKASQLERRARGLMLRAGVADWDDYLRLLNSEPERWAELRRCLSVPVSEFFRTPRQFWRLADVILPRLLEGGRALRAWSAGCAFGAEPYSIALLLNQKAPERDHYILATDIDEVALARGRAAAAFTDRELRHVPQELRRHFTAGSQPGRYALDAEVRRRVAFRRHDLLHGPAGKNFDLVVCRNVMMYFSGEAKIGLFATLNAALRPGGYLFVGDAEVLNELPKASFAREAVGFYRKLGCGGDQ